MVERLRMPAVIIDIDGVLCDNISRQMEYRATHPEQTIGQTTWDDFHLGYSDDRPRVEYVRLTACLSPGLVVILLTCRQEAHRSVTKEWLRVNGIGYDHLIMWDPDSHGYYEHKAQAFDSIAKRWDVRLVIEDSATHAQMFRDRGVPVIQVPDGMVSESEFTATQ